MRFTVHETVPFAPERVFTAERDELAAIVPFLSDVEGVTLRSEVTGADGDAVQVHRWLGSPRALPVFVRPMVRPELLMWDQTTRWSAGTLTATWSIVVPAMGDAVEARGTRTYQLQGRGTGCAVVVEGDITFRTAAPGAMGVPPTAAPFVERFVVGLVVPMVGRTTVAVGRYLERKR